MKTKRLLKSLSLLLCTVLTVAMALSTTACNGNTSPESSEEAFTYVDNSSETEPSSKTEVSSSEEPSSKTEVSSSEEPSSKEESLVVEEVLPPLKPTEYGEGATKFTISVTDYDGVKTVCVVNTDEKTVGDALEKLGLVEGEEGVYGLYIKKVMGIRADYDLDGKYWAFYIDGNYATKGIDLTEITAGTQYELKVE